MRKSERHLHRRGQGALIAGALYFVGFVALLSLVGFGAYKMGWIGPAHYDVGSNAQLPSGSQIVQVQQAQSVSCQGSNPSYTYAGADPLQGGSVAGTDYIKQNANIPATSLSGPIAGAALQYWKSNASYFCDVQTQNAVCGNGAMQSNCYQNGTATVSVYDNDNAVTLSNSATAGTQNVSIGANEAHHLNLKFTASGNKPTMAFGGCMIVEHPATIPAPVISGDLDGTKCTFNLHYTTTSTSNVYDAYQVPAGWDVDLKSGKAPLKQVGIELDSTGTNPSGAVYVTFRAANTYLVTGNTPDPVTKVSHNGQFATDIEQYYNGQSTTQAMPGQIQTAFAVN